MPEGDARHPPKFDFGERRGISGMDSQRNQSKDCKLGVKHAVDTPIVVCACITGRCTRHNAVCSLSLFLRNSHFLRDGSCTFAV